MPTRMTWRPGREGPTLYAYPAAAEPPPAKPDKRPLAEAEAVDRRRPATSGPPRRSVA